ncbi:unnamed protein product [Periconia digitata]|uniref:Zn(2)-C6 fungal-type domain-containing protein n=1 Tax=Periconia digitata TaxID=1303443 RepID=A0A9W4U994_9PLEO|nr:unnamed protein product [Periconia digitata]
MLGILRVGSEKDSVEFIEHAKGEAASRLGGYVFSHSACENCRLKKLRCSGHRSGCDRCRSQSLKCSYQTADSNSSRPKSKSHSQPNLSDISGTADTGDLPSSLDNSATDQEIGGWGLSDLVSTTSQFPQDLSHVGQDDHSNLDDLQHGLGFGSELDYSDNDLNDLFNSISCFQPDNSQTDVSMMDDIDGVTISQPASAGVHSSFMDFDHASTSPLSRSRQNSQVSLNDDFFAPSIGRARSRTDTADCQCRRSILRILSEIESNIVSASPSNMYAILSYQRRTTAASNDILTSRICNCRIKCFGLLEIIGEKITSLAEAIITAFVCRVKEQNDSVDFSDPDSPEKRLEHDSPMQLGEFQVQTLQELKVVSAAVIKLQLKYSITFVSRTRELAISINRLAQAQSLKKLENRLKELLLKMQRMTSEVELDSRDA